MGFPDLMDISLITSRLSFLGHPWLQEESLSTALAAAICILLLTIIFSRRYLSPLRDLPGPFLASATQIWYARAAMRGDMNVRISKLHEKHGHFVRIAPNEVSITHPEGVKKVLLQPMRKHPDGTTLRNIQAQTITNIGGGADTTSCALQSTIYHMIRHPTAWRKAQAEIDAAQKRGRCLDKVVSVVDAQELLYIEACIREGLRIHSPVSMGLPRVAPKQGVTVSERTFPEGTTLSINPWVLHHSTEIWGSDANGVNPDRLLKDDSHLLEKNWIPFGVCWMGCPDQHVALMELSKTCSTIIRDYDIKLVDFTKQWKWMAYITMVPTTWPVYISKREK